MVYRTLFEASGILQTNSGHKKTQDIYKNGFNMLLFDLKPDRSSSEVHTSHPETGTIRVVLKLDKPLSESIT